MAAGRDTIRCGLVWIWLGSGILESRSVLGRVISLGQLPIGSLGGGSVDRGLAMGREGLGMVFVILESLGKLIFL